MVVTCCSQRQCVLISQKKNTKKSMDMFIKRHPLPGHRKINMVIKMFLFLGKRALKNAEGLTLLSGGSLILLARGDKRD